MVNKLSKLDEWELVEFEEMDQEKKEKFVIDNDGALTWAFRKMKVLRLEQEEIKEMAKKEMERINEWQEKQVAGIEWNIGYFEGLIMEYALAKRKEDPFFKKKSTPHGTVNFRKQREKWNYEDEKLLKFLEDNKDYEKFITVKKSTNKVDLKKCTKVVDGKLIMEETGEVIEGVEIVSQEDAIDIKPTKED